MSRQIPPSQARAHAYEPTCYGCGEPEDTDKFCVEVWVTHLFLDRPVSDAACAAERHDLATQERSHALAMRVPFWVMP